jgi:hypothetical protein
MSRGEKNSGRKLVGYDDETLAGTYLTSVKIGICFYVSLLKCLDWKHLDLDIWPMKTSGQKTGASKTAAGTLAETPSETPVGAPTGTPKQTSSKLIIKPVLKQFSAATSPALSSTEDAAPAL